MDNFATPYLPANGTSYFNTFANTPWSPYYPYASSSNTNKELTWEEYQKKIKADKEKQAALSQEIKTLEQAYKENNEALKLMENGKKADGSVVKYDTLEVHRKKPWYKKLGRALGNMGLGIWKVTESFAGFEDGKWNWKKFTKNIGIAAACIGLCAIPYVGPVIAGALIGVGAVTGVVNIVKGTIKATKAETLEELDHAYQDIGAGAFTAVMSCIGAKGIGKNFRVSNPSSASVGSTKFSTAFKDMTVNFYKATKHNVGVDKSMISSNGFWKTYKHKLTPDYKNLASKKNFDNTKAQIENRLKIDIDEQNRIINHPASSDYQKQLARIRKSSLEKTQAELRSAQTKSQWDAMRKNSELSQYNSTLDESLATFNKDGSVAIDGHTYSTSDATFKSDLRAIIKENKALNKELRSLCDSRTQSMRNMSTSRLLSRDNTLFSSEINNYVGPNRGFWSEQWAINQGVLRNSLSFKGLFNGTMTLLDLPFKPYRYFSKGAGTAGYNIEQVIRPTYTTWWFAERLDAKTAGDEMARLTQENAQMKKAIEMANKQYSQIGIA